MPIGGDLRARGRAHALVALVSAATLLLAGCGASAHRVVLSANARPDAPSSRHPVPLLRPTASHPRKQPNERAVLRKDPALRFVLLAVPHTAKLKPSAALIRASRGLLSLRIHGQHVVVILPRHPNGRAILYEHGSDGSANYDIDRPRSGRTITALVAAGYTFAESDAGFNNWGNAASVADDVAVAVWLRDHGVTDIDLGSGSMGGLDATQLIPLVHPEAVFELFPVCDERTMVHLFGVDIRHADAPIAALSPVPMLDVAGLPILITASPQDELVNKTTNADVCTAEARAAGASVREVTTSGNHDDPSNWTPSRLIAFLNAGATSR